jgi:hypothetical protein
MFFMLEEPSIESRVPEGTEVGRGKVSGDPALAIALKTTIPPVEFGMGATGPASKARAKREAYFL